MILHTYFRRAVLALAIAAATLAALPARSEDTPAADNSFNLKSATEKVWTGAQDIAVYALGLIGVNYKFGGNTPDAGLDCSGLVRYVFQEVTGVNLPRTAREMGKMGEKVALPDLKPGDLVFFNTRRFAYSHVGIYLGDNRFIHAPSRGSEVEIAQIDTYWKKHFNGARRFVGALPGLMIPSAQAAAVEPDGTQAPAATDKAEVGK